MKTRIAMSVVGLTFLAAAVCGPAVAQQGGGQADVPSWESLSKQAQEASDARYSTDELETQIEKKEAHLENLQQERETLREKLIQVIKATKDSVEQVDNIDDPQLRDEALLKVNAEKNIRLKTLQRKLEAVKGEISRGQDELNTVRQLLRSRRAEARLHGHETPTDKSYDQYLAQEAGKARLQAENTFRRLRAARLQKLEEAILPLIEPRVPDVTTAVLWNNEG